MTAALALRLAGSALAGLVFGAGYFVALRVNAALYLAPDRRRLAAILHAGRVSAAVAGWFLVARFGGPALIAALGGLLVARQAVVRRALGVP